ncbi:MAG: alpha/beta fold hydrolase [Anaerolineales bacterium]|nr:alpha/beta fold hydrolase [Anaerolineales bacterium]
MKPLLLKLLLFVTLLFILQLAVTALYPPHLPDEISQLDRYLQDDTDIIYFGDSTLIYPVGQVTTGEILQEMVPEQTIGQIAHPAYNADLYRRYADYIIRFDHRPDSVIIPINMHSFSPEWDRRPAYQFATEKVVLTYGPLLSTIVYRPLATFGGFDSPISQADYWHTPVFSGTTPVGQVGDFEERLGHATFAAQANNVASAYYRNLPGDNDPATLETSLVYYYMGTLDPHHRKIQALLDTARRLKAGGIKPIFYITPINTQLGDRVLGETFSRQIEANTVVVEQAFRREKLDVLNLALTLEPYYFVDTEHLTENGKARVAEALAALIHTGSPDQITSTRSDQSDAARAAPGSAIAQITSPPTATTAASAVGPTPISTQVVRQTNGAGSVTAVEVVGTFEPVGNYFVDLYRIRYQTLTDEDQPVEARAYLYIPLTAEKEAFPVLAYGNGTTGIGPNCAPLDEIRHGANWGGHHYQMLEYAAQGFIVVWPNGQGFDDTQPAHPYFIAKNEARTMLDAVRATYNFIVEGRATGTEAKPLAAVFLGGYSSGGHAAFAAKDWAARYAPELTITGVLGHGPTTNVETLMKENPIFSPYLVYAYRAFYGEVVIDPTRVFQDNWLVSFNSDAMTQCIDDIYFYYSPNARLMYRAEFRDALYTDRLASFAPQFKRALDTNASGLAGVGMAVPVLILQGTADMVVTPPSQEQFVTELCRRGSRVTYLTYPAIDHAQTRIESFRDTISWMNTLADGGRPKSSCGSLTGQ